MNKHSPKKQTSTPTNNSNNGSTPGTAALANGQSPQQKSWTPPPLLTNSPLLPSKIVETLTEEELQKLTKCEQVIKEGVKSFFEVGTALLEIRDGKLYRDHYETFDAYCKEKWEFGKSHAYRLINAAETMLHVSPIGDEDAPVPANEAQLRPLVGLQPEEAKTAWIKAVENAADGHVTAKLVKEAAEEFRKPAEKPAAPSAPKAAPEPPAQPTGPAVGVPSKVKGAPAPPQTPMKTVVIAQPTASTGERSANDIAIESADNAVTYLRTKADGLTPTQLHHWGRLLKQIIDLCTKLGVKATE